MVSKIGAMLLRSLQEHAQPTAGWAWRPALLDSSFRLGQFEDLEMKSGVDKDDVYKVTSSRLYHNARAGWVIAVIFFLGLVTFSVLTKMAFGYAVTVLMGVYCYRVLLGMEPRGYRLLDDGVHIICVWGEKVIRFEHIEQVSAIESGKLKWRMLLSGLPVMRVGVFYVKPIGFVLAYAGTQDRYIVIKRRGKCPILLSPERLDEFLSEIGARRCCVYGP